MFTRIMIFGKPGSGKSTFALKLHEKSGIPLYHLDRCFYATNWVERDYVEFINMQRQIVDQNSWIIDGNNLQSLELRYKRAHVAIYFNYQLIICLWRLFKRRLLGRRINIDDRAEGCTETVRWSLIKYTWAFEKSIKSRGNIDVLRKRYTHVKFAEANGYGDLKKVLELFDLV